jgi:hypothetical protein
MNITNSTKAKSKYRLINVGTLGRHELDNILPFGTLCETWFSGRWSNGGNGDVYAGPRFLADTRTEKWIDLLTGAHGEGSIALAAYFFEVDETEAERRMRLWADAAAPHSTPEGDIVWSIPIGGAPTPRCENSNRREASHG